MTSTLYDGITLSDIYDGRTTEDDVATVKEAFKAKYQGNKNVEIVEVSFAVGEEVVVLKSWEGDTCLIKKGDQVFNVPKRYLSST